MTRFQAAEAWWKGALRVLERLAADPEVSVEVLEEQERLVNRLARHLDWLRSSPEGDLPARAA